jgi:hypothetical protein
MWRTPILLLRSSTAVLTMGMLALLVVPRVVLGALAAADESISVPPAAPSPCELAGATWSYMAPEDFEGVAANNEAGCLYAFEPAAAGGGFNFSSPAACRGDSWKLATGAVSPGSAGRQVLLTFSGGTHHKGQPPQVQHRGWATPDCQFIDMDDGGLFIRGRHPFDMAPHEWLRMATAWVMRAAMITFADGSRHITPGVPKPVPKPTPNDGYYVGQWMRDGFYGISNGWGLVNETVHRTFAEDAEFALAHARADGMLPQYCPPPGPGKHGACQCVVVIPLTCRNAKCTRELPHSLAPY